MRFVAGGAAFIADGRVLEGEGTTFIAVAFDAARLIAGKGLAHGGLRGPVRIVAIDARHRILGNLVPVRLLKLCHDIQVAAGAKLIDLFGRSCHQANRPVGVNRMAGNAGDRILHMAALNTAHMGRLVQMAGEADFVRLGGH